MLQRRPFITRSLTLGAATALPALVPSVALAAARVGQPAPAFSLTDTKGKTITLAQLLGKPVVLEWTNPGCPFVRKHYVGNMQSLQKAFTGQGVAWLAINSTRDDSADYLSPAQLARWMSDQGASPSATLMDEDGQVGAAYGARVTPHMYIVNAQGTLVYAGGIDSIASARAADIEKAVNHVRNGLNELLAGKPISVPTSQPYGCSIKYKNAPA